MTAEEFRAILARHGGLIGTEVLDKSTEEAIAGHKTGEMIPPATVRVRYTTKDGEITARQKDDGTYEVIEDAKGLVKGVAHDDRKPQIVNVGGGKIGVASVDEAGKGSYTPIDTGPGPMVQRPTGRTQTSEGRTTPVTESVTKEQADYDRQVAGDQRQAAQDLQARLQAAEANALAQARARIEQEKWTAEQANTEYNKSLDKIRLEAQAEVNALTRRSQDITVRGQDLSAGVAQRGQDLSFQGGLVSNAADLQKALIPGFAQPEQWQAIRQGINDTRKIGGQAPLPDFRGGPPPYDPMQFTQQAARMALQQTPSPYTLPGAPAQVPPGQYQLPG